MMDDLLQKMEDGGTIIKAVCFTKQPRGEKSNDRSWNPGRER